MLINKSVHMIFVHNVGFAGIQLPRDETVYVAGAIWGPATTFNLYGLQSTWGTDQFLYLEAFIYDLGKNAWISLVAEDYTFLNDKTVRIHIRPEAR